MEKRERLNFNNEKRKMNRSPVELQVRGIRIWAGPTAKTNNSGFISSCREHWALFGPYIPQIP
jgi:hypothetical protein